MANTSYVRVELRPNEMKWFRQFSHMAAHFAIGVHCRECCGDLQGINDGHSDPHLAVRCHCREFVSPDFTWEPAPTPKGWMRQFAIFLASQKLLIHCSLCRQTLQEKFTTSDTGFVAACKCREFRTQVHHWSPDARVSLH